MCPVTLHVALGTDFMKPLGCMLAGDRNAVHAEHAELAIYYTCAVHAM